MPFYQFKCGKCRKEFITLFILDDKVWYRCPDGQKNVKLKVSPDDAPMHAPCTNKNCKNRRASRYDEDAPIGIVKGVTGAGKRDKERYMENGMPKHWANKFYNESIAASKERMKTGGEVYKKVDPHIPTLEKMGACKKVDEKTANTKKLIFKSNSELVTKIKKGQK